jgi:hypothetical protein
MTTAAKKYKTPVTYWDGPVGGNTKAAAADGRKMDQSDERPVSTGTARDAYFLILLGFLFTGLVLLRENHLDSPVGVVIRVICYLPT